MHNQAGTPDQKQSRKQNKQSQKHPSSILPCAVRKEGGKSKGRPWLK
jgi:hypothetical protein